MRGLAAVPRSWEREGLAVTVLVAAAELGRDGLRVWAPLAHGDRALELAVRVLDRYDDVEVPAGLPQLGATPDVLAVGARANSSTPSLIVSFGMCV